MGERAPQRIRVVTLNVFAHHGDWSRRRPILAEGFRRLDADIIALQEVVRNDRVDQARDILGDGYHLFHQTRGKIDATGIAIASRWPFRHMDEHDLHVATRIGNSPTFALVAGIDGPEPIGPILFATYPSEYRPGFELEREQQAVAAATLLESLVDGDRPHVIVAGDMNADPDAASMRFWTGRQSLGGVSVCYRDAWERTHPGEPGPTFTPENRLMGEMNRDWPFRQIDHILVRCSTHGLPTLDIETCERIFSQQIEGTWASDHYGLLAGLRVPDPDGGSS